MGDLNEAIDRAMDAAEAKIDEKEEVIQESPEAETIPQEDVAETIALKEAIDKTTEEKPASGKARDASGKFTKQKPTLKTADAKEAAETPAEEETSGQDAVNEEGGPVVKSEDQESEALGTEFPIYWPAELKQAVAKSQPEVQKALVAYEAQRTEWANRIANESQRGKAIEKRATEVFEPYKLKLQAQGIQDPFEATQRLLAWNEIFEKDPKTGIADLMRKNGLTPDDFYEDERNQVPQYQDPRVDEALRKAEEAEKKFTNWQQEQEQRALHTEIETFKNGKDSFGHVRRQFAELHAKPISDAFESILAQYPNMPRPEALNHAYEFVQKEVRAMYGIPAKPTLQTAPKPDAAAQAKRAKAAASSVTGAPSAGTSTPRSKAKTIDEALDRAEERMGLR